MKITPFFLLITASIYAPNDEPLTPRRQYIYECMQTEEGKNQLAQLAYIRYLKKDPSNAYILTKFKELPTSQTVMSGDFYFTFMEYEHFEFNSRESTANSKSSIKDIIKLIESAEHTIIIFALNFQITAIKTALDKKKDINIYVFVDKKDQQLGKNKTKNQILNNGYTYIVTMNQDNSDTPDDFKFFHHKMIIVDFMHIAFGSLNLSINSPINNCEDYFMGQVNPVYLATKLQKYINHLKNSDNFLLSAPHSVKLQKNEILNKIIGLMDPYLHHIENIKDLSQLAISTRRALLEELEAKESAERASLLSQFTVKKAQITTNETSLSQVFVNLSLNKIF